MNTEEPRTKTVCLGKTTICHQEECLKGAIAHPEIVKLFLIEHKLNPSAETNEWMKENAPKDVQEILSKVEMNKKLQNKLVLSMKPTLKISPANQDGTHFIFSFSGVGFLFSL